MASFQSDEGQAPGGKKRKASDLTNDFNAYDEDDKEDENGGKKGRRKIKIEFIEDKSRRHITFSKRKSGIMKKAYELSTLTGTQVLLLVASETGHVYTFATPKLQPLITKPEGKNLIQSCLNVSGTAEGTDDLPETSESANDQSTSSGHVDQVEYQGYPRDSQNNKGNHEEIVPHKNETEEHRRTHHHSQMPHYPIPIYSYTPNGPMLNYNFSGSQYMPHQGGMVGQSQDNEDYEEDEDGDKDD
ncbi:hypothetical protein HK096_008809 [Nowakowskiella sp. JEL0078]|nr:hypothetical protein HK096_008809 [Nowakowskiella sp. JEL0078]